MLDLKTESLLHLPGYEMWCLNRSRMVKGGLAVNVSEYFLQSVRRGLSKNEKGMSESMFIEIKTQTKALIVGYIYQSSSRAVPFFLHILDKDLEAIEQHFCELLIMGTWILIFIVLVLGFSFSYAWLWHIIFCMYSNPHNWHYYLFAW